MASSAEVDKANRRKFTGEVYGANTICTRMSKEAKDYTSRMLALKFEMIATQCPGDTLVDLCCGVGSHLKATAANRAHPIGVDFSDVYLDVARKDNDQKLPITWICANARSIPLGSGTVDALYSISSLYCIPALEEVIGEVSRILRPGGRCLLDLGARPSINTIVCNAYPELATPCHVRVKEMLAACELHGLNVVEHRSFQILPMWGSRPYWLKPLLHPIWSRLLAVRVNGKMLDEWISSLPFVRNFAFRQLLLCEKR